MKNLSRLSSLAFAAIFVLALTASASFPLFAAGTILPTDKRQNDFFKAYKFVLYESAARNYRTYSSADADTILFPKYGECSVYWIAEGSERGSFLIPEKLPSYYASLENKPYDNYDWREKSHYSIQFRWGGKKVAIFRSKILYENNTVSWESIYFKNIFDSYLYGNIYYFVNEDFLDTADINSSTDLLIIPSYSVNGQNQKYYIDQTFAICPKLKSKLDKFLKRGGTIYAEGNAAYFIEKLGYLRDGAVDFQNYESPDPVSNLVKVSFESSKNPLSYVDKAVNGTLWGLIFPKIEVDNAEIVAKTQAKGYPVCFALEGSAANGGKIVINTGLPAIGGYKEAKNGSRQAQWTLNAILYAWARKLDYFRSVYNEIPDTLTVGKNAVSYDRKDTFEIRIVVRNLSDAPANEVTIREYIRSYFEFVGVETSGINANFANGRLTINVGELLPKSEKVVVYKLATPDPDDPIHEKIDNYLSGKDKIYASVGYIDYESNAAKETFAQYRDYAQIMFSAFLAVDTDLNWKNFLGLY